MFVKLYNFYLLKLKSYINWSFWYKHKDAYTNRLYDKALTYFLETDRLEIKTKFEF